MSLPHVNLLILRSVWWHWVSLIFPLGSHGKGSTQSGWYYFAHWRPLWLPHDLSVSTQARWGAELPSGWCAGPAPLWCDQPPMALRYWPRWTVPQASGRRSPSSGGRGWLSVSDSSCLHSRRQFFCPSCWPSSLRRHVGLAGGAGPPPKPSHLMALSFSCYRLLCLAGFYFDSVCQLCSCRCSTLTSRCSRIGASCMSQSIVILLLLPFWFLVIICQFYLNSLNYL